LRGVFWRRPAQGGGVQNGAWAAVEAGTWFASYLLLYTAYSYLEIKPRGTDMSLPGRPKGEYTAMRSMEVA